MHRLGAWLDASFYKVELVERTRDCVEVVEHRFLIGSALCAFFAVVAAGMVLWPKRPGEAIVGACFTAFLVFAGLYCAVESRFIVERGERCLRVERYIGPIRWVRRFPVTPELSVVIKHPEGRAHGLAVRLPDGKRHTLTMSSHGQSLDRCQAALDHAIRVERRFHA
ncbi:MAG: hypothetical protein U0Q16_04255 [Bryobacteraceae bacterium]